MSEKDYTPAVLKTAVALSALPKVTAFVEAELERAECPLRVCMQLDIAIDEIFSNIARYSGASRAEIECAAHEGTVTLRFIDDGMPYDPTEAPAPDLTLPMLQREIGGLGVYMVKKTMDELQYKYENQQNVLTLIKHY